MTNNKASSSCDIYSLFREDYFHLVEKNLAAFFFLRQWCSGVFSKEVEKLSLKYEKLHCKGEPELPRYFGRAQSDAHTQTPCTFITGLPDADLIRIKGRISDIVLRGR